jgi:hypothetical protein
MSWQMGVLKDRALLDSVVERAAEQFTSGAIYSDDNPPTGRYDRYSNEYARFCWDAAEIAGRFTPKRSARNAEHSRPDDHRLSYTGNVTLRNFFNAARFA